MDFGNIVLSSALDLPLKKKKDGSFHYPSGSVFNICFSSDFLIEEADEWRRKVWDAIRQRSDCRFFFLTKRIERFSDVIPEDWGDGWDNVAVGVSAENQKRVDERLSALCSLPIKHTYIALSPLLEKVDISKYITDATEGVVVGGESGQDTRALDFDWVLDVRRQCVEKNVDFTFRQTGSRLREGGIIRKINYFQESSRAKAYGVDHIKTGK